MRDLKATIVEIFGDRPWFEKIGFEDAGVVVYTSDAQAAQDAILPFIRSSTESFNESILYIETDSYRYAYALRQKALQTIQQNGHDNHTTKNGRFKNDNDFQSEGTEERNRMTLFEGTDELQEEIDADYAKAKELGAKMRDLKKLLNKKPLTDERKALDMIKQFCRDKAEDGNLRIEESENNTHITVTFTIEVKVPKGETE